MKKVLLKHFEDYSLWCIHLEDVTFTFIIFAWIVEFDTITRSLWN